jgi:hypothetical protein
MRITIASLMLAFTAVTAFPSMTDDQVSGSRIANLSKRNLLTLNKAISAVSQRETTPPSTAFSNVYLIKELSVASHRTEIHILDSSTSYATSAGDFATAFGESEWQYGTFVVSGGSNAGDDLFFIKLRDVGSAQVEIHRATAASGYQSFSIHAPTAFGPADALKGTWNIDDGDLYFIKTKDTGSGYIEIHRASRLNYSVFDLHQATSIPQSQAEFGKWAVFNKQLYFIKYRNTGGRKVELHILGPGDGYSRVVPFSTGFSITDAENGTWDIGLNGDLYFIKTQNTSSNKVEVQIATASSAYQEVFRFISWVQEADGLNGEWSAQ